MQENQQQTLQITDLTDQQLGDAFFNSSFELQTKQSLVSQLANEIAKRRMLAEQSKAQSKPIVLPKLKRVHSQISDQGFLEPAVTGSFNPYND